MGVPGVVGLVEDEHVGPLQLVQAHRGRGDEDEDDSHDDDARGALETAVPGLLARGAVVGVIFGRHGRLAALPGLCHPSHYRQIAVARLLEGIRRSAEKDTGCVRCTGRTRALARASAPLD